MLVFFRFPNIRQVHTILSIILCVLLILTPTDYRFALLTFIAGAGLGYFLELWGTTRECGRITHSKNLRCSLSLRTGWQLLRFGGRGCW